MLTRRNERRRPTVGRRPRRGAWIRTRISGSLERYTRLELVYADWQPAVLATGRIPRTYGAEYGSPTRLTGLEDQHLCHSAKGTKAEGEGVEPSRLIARRFSGRLPSPVGLSFRSSCGGRNRTCNRLLNREPPYHWATPQEVRTVGFEPTLSGSRNRRIAGLSYVLS